VSVVAQVVLTSALYGPDAWVVWAGHMLHDTGYYTASAPVPMMASVFGAVQQLNGSATAGCLFQFAAALSAAFVVGKVWGRTQSLDARWIVLPAAALLVPHMMMTYDVALWAVPLAWLLRDGIERLDAVERRALATLVLVDLARHFLESHLFFVGSTTSGLAVSIPTSPLIPIAMLWLGWRRSLRRQ
jgi:hypothetical protein